MRILVIGLAGLAAAAPLPLQPPPDSLAIASIRDAYARIERGLPAYRRVRHDLVDFSTEGGYLDAWFDGPHVKKLEAMYYGEMGRSSEAYYFTNDTLVFVYANTERYDRPLSGHVVGRDENRFYFHAQRLIRASNGTATRASEVQRTAQLLVACASAAPSDTAACTAPN